MEKIEFDDAKLYNDYTEKKTQEIKESYRKKALEIIDKNFNDDFNDEFFKVMQ